MKQIVNIGSAPNDATGEPIRSGGDKINQNFTELYDVLQGGNAGQFLRAVGSSSMSGWSTVTIPNTISALSIWLANSANVITEVTPSAGQSIRLNSGGTAWEAYTPTAAVSSIVGISGTKAQYNTSLTDGDFLFSGDITQYTDEQAQDAIGTIFDSTLSYNDGTPSIGRAAISGDVVIASGSNTSVIQPGAVDIAMLSATGTPSASTYLRGDNTWATVAGAGDVSSTSGSVDNRVARFDGTGKVIQGSDMVLDDSSNITLGTTSLGGSARQITVSGSSIVELRLAGMDSATTGVTAGDIGIYGGAATVGNANGGSISMYAGNGFGSGDYGNLYMGGRTTTINTKVTGQSDAQVYISSSTSTLTLKVGGGNTGASTTYNTIIEPDYTGGASVAGANLTIKAGAAGTGNNTGGNMYLMPGLGVGTGLDGNIGFFATSVSWSSSMERGLFIGAGIAPSAAPSNGVYMWVEQVNSVYELRIMDSAGNIKGIS